MYGKIVGYYGYVIWGSEYGYMVSKKGRKDEFFKALNDALAFIEEKENIPEEQRRSQKKESEEMKRHKAFEAELKEWVAKVLKIHEEMCIEKDAFVGADTWGMMVRIDKIIADGFNHARALKED